MARPFAGRDRFRVLDHGMRLMIAGALGLALPACSPGAGDFGRPRAGVWENSVLPNLGLFSARLRGEPTSLYALTENEKELRARAYHFLVPEGDAPVLAQMQDHAAFHRLLPKREHDITLFHRTVMGGPQLGATIGSAPGWRRLSGGQNFASLTSRYNRVRDTIMADHLLIPHFRLVAIQVIEADRVRALSFDRVGHLTEGQREQAIARICENAALIARVHWAYTDRAAQYRYALEHLLVEGPEREAIPAERALMAFESEIGRFRKEAGPGPVCAAPLAWPEPLAPRPLTRKG